MLFRDEGDVEGTQESMRSATMGKGGGIIDGLHHIKIMSVKTRYNWSEK